MHTINTINTISSAGIIDMEVACPGPDTHPMELYLFAPCCRQTYGYATAFGLHVVPSHVSTVSDDDASGRRL